ncbi:hypothetical protein FRC15_009319 [Serendipita sp. 397]|nr:hypothetical protein FRC15_009319 [Serendipita sp. 397]
MTSSGQMDVNSDSDESTRSNYRTVDIVGIGALDLHSQFEIISGLTYHDLSVQISRLVSNETLVALVPIFGPYPVFRYPHDGEAISPSARKIYVVDKKEDPSVVVVRTRDEDIPISVSLSAEDDQSLLEPVITRGISVHGYSPISIKDYLGMSDISDRNVARAKLLSEPAHPTIAFVETDSRNFEFRSRFREDALAHKQLQFLFSRGEVLVRKASCTEDYALQLIHLTRSLLHLIVSAQEMMWNNGSSQRLDYYLDLHRLADGLETCIKTQSSSEQDLESYFSGLCGDYFGAVAVRQSHDIFSCLMGACSVIHNPSTTLIQRRDALSHSSGTEHTSVHESASPSIGEKVQDFFEIARKDVHNVAVLLAEEFSKLGLKDGDPAPGERAVEKDGPRAGEGDTRKSLEDQSRKGRDTKARQISLGLPWVKEKAPDDVPISDTLRDPLRPAKIAVPLTKAEEKKKEEENKSEESDSDVYLSPEEKEVTDTSDDAAPHRGRSRGRKSHASPYPSTSRAPSGTPSKDWHPTEEPPPTEDERQGFERGLEELDKDHQSIVVHYGGNTFWTRRLVLQHILDYHNATGNWPMKVEKTGTSRANEGVHHAECVICNRGRNTQKLKVQHIAKHLISDEWKLKLWRCMLCPTAYSYNDGSLKTHMKNVHNKEEPNTRVMVDNTPNPPLPNPVAPSTSTAIQGYLSWSNPSEYTYTLPAYTGATNHLGPSLATPAPFSHQPSNSQPALDIVWSPPTVISNDGQPVIPTYVSSRSLPPFRVEGPIVSPMQPPPLGVAYTGSNSQPPPTGLIGYPYLDQVDNATNSGFPQRYTGFPEMVTQGDMIPPEQSQYWHPSYGATTSFLSTSMFPLGSMLQVHTMAESAHQLSPTPQAPTQPTTQPVTLPEVLEKLVEYFSRAEWVQKHEKEPLLLDNDPLIRLGLVQPGGSRFDALLFWDGEKDHCQVPGCQGSRDRTQHYTTERRPRALAHVYGHFGYKPIPCEGECGTVGCEMRFPDKPSKTEHVRAYTTPRTTCAVCRSTIARKNYKRHLKDVDRLSEDQIAALLGLGEEAAGMSA